MQDRQKQLLKLIVEHYIETAEPIGSKFLVEKSGLNISAPTVRNEMRALEVHGYLLQPHTSAGRVPTQKGYELYINSIMTHEPLEQEIAQSIDILLQDSDTDMQKIKDITKFASEHLSLAVMVSLQKDHMFYAGISALFAEPEFKDHAHTINVSHIFDQCEYIIEDIMKTNLVSSLNPYTIRIGTDNPFSKNCGAVIGYVSDGVIITMLGPIRMNYAKSLQLMKYILGLLA